MLGRGNKTPECQVRVVLAGETPETVVVTGVVAVEAEDARAKQRSAGSAVRACKVAWGSSAAGWRGCRSLWAEITLGHRRRRDSIPDSESVPPPA
jgi:hypothetical protein